MLPGPSIDARQKFIVIRNPDPVGHSSSLTLWSLEREPSRATLSLHFYQVDFLITATFNAPSILYKIHKYHRLNQNLLFTCVERDVPSRSVSNRITN